MSSGKNRYTRISILTALAALVAVNILMTVSCIGKGNSNRTDTADSVEVHEPEMRWGICTDSLDIVDGTIGNGDILSRILLEYGIGAQTMHHLSNAAEDVYSVRSLRAGNDYHILLAKDSTHRAEWFVYEISPVESAVYSLQDSLYCYVDTVPVDTVTRYISGKITSSLWNAMIDAGANPSLAGKLADVYSWTIDFFGVQQNDSFNVCYQDLIVNDTVNVGLGRVLASNFITGGKDHYAFRYEYEKEGRGEYFDETGASLQRAFLKAPLNYTRISSRFSNGRMHPILKIVRAHHGVDYAAPSGTPVYTVGDGVVTAKGWDSKGGGNYLKIKHNAIYTTEYMHLKGFAKGIAQGTHVKQGEVIGYVGATGLATGPHLDYRVFKNGTPINPLSMDLPAIDPIDSVDMPAYLEAIAPLKQMIGFQE